MEQITIKISLEQRVIQPVIGREGPGTFVARTQLKMFRLWAFFLSGEGSPITVVTTSTS